MRRIKPGSIGQYFTEGLWDGPMIEVHSSLCAHCQKMTEFPSLKRMFDYVDICRSCMGLVCLECYGKKVCTPFVKKIEKFEEEHQKKLQRRRLGL